MSALATLGLTLRARGRRILILAAFALAFLAAAGAVRVLFAGPEGRVAVGQVFRLGGYPLASALLLMGWVLGRYPLVATLALMAGLVSRDREAGYARLYHVRPVSLLGLYGARFLALALVAFLLSAVLLPTFDLLMLGTWAGPATFVLIAAYVLVYGGLTALLSVWTRADAWIALLLAVISLVWSALRGAGMLPVPPGLADFVAFVLPPQAALFRLESAFAGLEPIPWDAFAYAAGYGAVMLILAGLSLVRREL